MLLAIQVTGSALQGDGRCILSAGGGFFTKCVENIHLKAYASAADPFISKRSADPGTLSFFWRGF